MTEIVPDALDPFEGGSVGWESQQGDVVGTVTGHLDFGKPAEGAVRPTGLGQPINGYLTPARMTTFLIVERPWKGQRRAGVDLGGGGGRSQYIDRCWWENVRRLIALLARFLDL